MTWLHQARSLCRQSTPPKSSSLPFHVGCAQVAVDRRCTACLMYHDSNTHMIDYAQDRGPLGVSIDRQGESLLRSYMRHWFLMKSGAPRIHGRKMRFFARDLCRPNERFFHEKESAPNTSGFSKNGTFSSIYHPSTQSCFLTWHLPEPNPLWPWHPPRSRAARRSRPA